MHKGILDGGDAMTDRDGNTKPPAKRGWIDVHHHIAPPAYLAEGGPGVGAPLKAWSLAKSIEDMDRAGIATSVVSITQLSKHIAGDEQRRRLARSCNEYAARLVSDHRGRFGMFTALPLPDIEGSLAEIEYGMDVPQG